jgi:hypothetical protein
MTSLRVALKLSMAENKDGSSAPPGKVKSDDEGNDVAGK